MPDDIDHWKQLAKRVGIERDNRALKRTRLAKELDWAEWTQEEREVYACAFLYPATLEPMIDGITINGSVLNLAKYSRTATIIDAQGDVWTVIEHGRPQKV